MDHKTYFLALIFLNLLAFDTATQTSNFSLGIFFLFIYITLLCLTSFFVQVNIITLIPSLTMLSDNKIIDDSVPRTLVVLRSSPVKSESELSINTIDLFLTDVIVDHNFN